jgi:hypothetical protein
MRYFGFFAPGRHKHLAVLRQQLELTYPSSRNFCARIKVVLPTLPSAVAVPACYPANWTLPTMSRFGFPPPLFFWMLGFHLTPRLRFASAQEQSSQTTVSHQFWIVRTGFLTIQWMYNHLQDDEFNRVLRLKFQLTGYIC